MGKRSVSPSASNHLLSAQKLIALPPMILSSNLFTDLPGRLPDELVTTLLETAGVRIERIVSNGHASPEDFWYDQEQDEWVMVLRGAARLRIKDEEPPVEMKPGAFVNIPAHTKHRVEWTAQDEPTIWLAVYYGGQR
jgi:cupin 2 domain-containing protein